MDDILKDSWQPEGPISQKIKERIQKAGKRFHANDNISDYIEEGELNRALLSKMIKCSIIHDKSKRTQQGNMSG